MSQIPGMHACPAGLSAARQQERCQATGHESAELAARLRCPGSRQQARLLGPKQAGNSWAHARSSFLISMTAQTTY